jgi:hypothetical protein
MNFSEVIGTAATVVVSLGGGGAIVLGLSNWIGKIFADRYFEKIKHEIQQEIESYKTKLRKSEFLFQREFDAASQFIALRRSLMPRYSFPEMEWDDACKRFARNFAKAETELERYMATHGGALKQTALDRLSSAIDKVISGKIEVSSRDVSYDGVQIAGKVMDELGGIEKGAYGNGVVAVEHLGVIA